MPLKLIRVPNSSHFVQIYSEYFQCPNPKSMINMTNTSMSGSKEHTSGKGAHQNMLNHFGSASMVTSWNAQYFFGFWRVWHISTKFRNAKKKLKTKTQTYIRKLIKIFLSKL